MNLEPLNSKFRARYYRIGHADSLVILADAMRSNVRRKGGLLSPEDHYVELFNGGEKVAQLLLIPGEVVLLFDPIRGVIDEAREPAKIEGVIETRTKASSYEQRRNKQFAAQYVSGSISSGSSVKAGSTMYTVPPHVGQNVEVPVHSIIHIYDPKARGL